MALPERFRHSDSTLFLIDISSFIFRAFFGVRPLHAPSGEPTNAVYGVAQMIGRLREDGKPRRLACVFDSKEPSFRKELYTEYKANRSAPPEDLVPQFDRIEELTHALRIPVIRQSGVEADDLIATLALSWQAQDPSHQVVIVSSDKDLMQLVNAQVVLWDTMNDKVYDVSGVTEKFGVAPEQVRDYLALVGDSSDNIPGVEGIGPKTAVDLLKAHGTLAQILDAAEAGTIPGKRGETLKASRQAALLSAELATLKTDLKTKNTPAELSYEFQITPELDALFQELGFQSLLKRWRDANGDSRGVPSPDVPTIAKPSEAPFEAVRTKAQFDALIALIERHKAFGFDLETTSLNPREAEIVGLAFAFDETKGFYLPINHRSQGIRVEAQLEPHFVMERLKPYLEDPRYKKIGQNLKYDFSVLRAQGIEPDGIGADTMVASYVLSPEGRHNLAVLAQTHLNYTVLPYEDVCGKGVSQIRFDEVPIETATRYSAEDAWITLKLWNRLLPELERERLMPVFAQIDLPLVDVLSRMELAGVCIDSEFLRSYSKELQGEIDSIEKKVYALAGREVNLNSPKQLAQLLFEELKLPVQSKTKTGPSTDASVLEALAEMHEIPKLILQYREIAKLKGTYVDPLPELVDPRTNRVHASFHQTVAQTGRLSSSDPNLQNIPIRTERGRRVRRAFLASPGNVLVGADYSQIELRILAHMSGDPELTKSFQKNEDVHRRTAGEIFGVSPDAVTDSQRAVAKAINFGLMYGKTAFGLSQELGISRKEAAETIERYFSRYVGVKAYLDRAIETAKATGETHTLLGRRRKLPEIHSKNHAIRANAERMAMNSPIQGTAADLMKLAMLEIDRRLRDEGFRSKLTIQVHDEVVLDCPIDEAPRVKALVIEAMEGALKLSVPLTVNASSGHNWMEL